MCAELIWRGKTEQ